MEKELNDYLRLTFVQVLADEWKEMYPKLIASKTLSAAYEIYEDYEIRTHNWNNYFRLRIKNDKDIEDAKI